MNNTYAEEMESDIREYIKDEIDREEWAGRREALEEYLNEQLFCSGVTGNDCGSYYCNRAQAKETVIENMDLLGEALSELCVESDTIAKKFIEEDWEYFDVAIRCYQLSQSIRAVLGELEIHGYFEEEETDESL